MGYNQNIWFKCGEVELSKACLKVGFLLNVCEKKSIGENHFLQVEVH
jgi:hypothetical protein